MTPYTLIRAKRRSISIQVNDDLDVIVRAPRWVSRREIDEAVRSKEAWIQRRVRQVQDENERLASSGYGTFALSDLDKLKHEAKAKIPGLVERYAGIMGVTYNRVTIRAQKTRWGSCSAKGNLNFNCLLMLAPPAVLEYVVVHELCHRKHMNHGAAFWGEVASFCPDYKEAERWLKSEGRLVLKGVIAQS